MSTRARRIVVGFDGSEPAKRALERAADLTGYGSTLTVVTAASDRADDVQTAARELLLGRHVTASYVQPAGEPADSLIEIACALDADILVIGRHTQSEPRAASLGSVSTAVVGRAECDVLVVGD